MGARTGCCLWNMAKLSPADGSVIWKTKVVAQAAGGINAQDQVVEIEPLWNTNDLLVVVGNSSGGPSYTLCRVDSTGAVLWSYFINRVPQFGRSRCVGSDGTYVVVLAALNLVGLDYSGNVLWSISTTVAAFNVMVFNGYSTFNTSDGPFALTTVDNSSGGVVSTYAGNSGDDIPVATYHNSGAYLQAGAVHLEVRNTGAPALSGGSPLYGLGFNNPSGRTHTWKRSRIALPSDNLPSVHITSVPDVRTYPSIAIPPSNIIATIPASTSPFFTPYDVAYQNGSNLFFIGCNNQTSTGIANPFNICAFSSSSGGFIWGGPQVGKNNTFGDDPACYSLTLDYPGNYLYVGGPIGSS